MPAFTKIATVNVGAGGTANITFNSISSAYTDLMIILSARTTGTTSYYDSVGIRWNSLTSNWAEAALRGNGATSTGLTQTANNYLIYQYVNSNSSSTANMFGVMKFYLPRYAETTFLKTHITTSVSENNATNSAQTMTVGGNTSTSAITSILLSGDQNGGLWAEYTTATLYGIKNSNA